jgi:hypothetical protein
MHDRAKTGWRRRRSRVRKSPELVQDRMRERKFMRRHREVPRTDALVRNEALANVQRGEDRDEMFVWGLFDVAETVLVGTGVPRP